MDPEGSSHSTHTASEDIGLTVDTAKEVESPASRLPRNILGGNADFKTAYVCGIPFASTTLDEAVEWILDRAETSPGHGVSVRLANAFCVSLANLEPSYLNLLKVSGINFPDGTPITWMLRHLSRDESGKAGHVRGPTLFLRVLDKGRQKQVRHLFLGSTTETLKLLVSSVEASFPGVNIVGAHSTKFGPVDAVWLREAIAIVEATRPDIVWVALGTPKQDYATQLLADRAGVMAIGVGAAFDFAAGTVREAPGYLQNTGLEWVYRLASEPKRLWRRYLFGNFHFIWLATRSIASRRKETSEGNVVIDLR